MLSLHYEGPDAGRPACTADDEAVRTALHRYASALGLRPEW